MSGMFVGALGGCLATLPMTWAMEMMHRQLPRREQYPLPPPQITMRVAEKAGVKKDMDEDERQAATLTAHFGMGTAMGVGYGLLGRHLPLPTPLAGATFGLAVWAGNYLGLLPALGLLRPATEHPPRRTGLMIAAHVIWGVTAAAIVDLLTVRTEHPTGHS